MFILHHSIRIPVYYNCLGLIEVVSCSDHVLFRAIMETLHGDGDVVDVPRETAELIEIKFITLFGVENDAGRD